MSSIDSFPNPLLPYGFCLSMCSFASCNFFQEHNLCNWVLVGKPEGKRPLGRPRHRWEDNIKMDLQEVGCGGMDWIKLDQERDRWQALVNAVMNLGVP